MINKKKKKGFTIVELVIVIVIIGVLAAVLIPTFGSLIKKANESADKQTVYQMNIILAAELIDVDESLTSEELFEKVKDILTENDIDVDNLKPKSDGHKFMWDEDNKVVILVKPSDDGNTLTQIYPAVDEQPVWGNVVSFGPAGEPITSLTQIEKGGEYYLESSLEITEAFSLPAGTTLNLNKQTLTLGTNVCLTVCGVATKSSSEEDDSNDNAVIIKNGTVQISPAYTEDEVVKYGALALLFQTDQDSFNEKYDKLSSDEQEIFENFYYRYTGPYANPGIDIEANGTLTLEGVTIEGNRNNNIGNEGTVHLNGVDFKVKSGTGLQNEGTAEITGGKFTASGEGVCLFYNYYDSYYSTTKPIATIKGTEFNEDTQNNTVSYYQSAPIHSTGGTLKLTNAQISANSATYNIKTTAGSVEIDGGSYDKPFYFKCDEDSTIKNLSFDLGGSTIQGIGTVTVTIYTSYTDEETGETVINDITLSRDMECTTQLKIIGEGNFKASSGVKIIGEASHANIVRKIITLSGKTNYYTMGSDAPVSVEVFRQTHVPVEKYGTVIIEDATIDLGDNVSLLNDLTTTKRYHNDITSEGIVEYKNCTLKGGGYSITVTEDENTESTIKGGNGITTIKNATITVTDTELNWDAIADEIKAYAACTVEGTTYKFMLDNCTLIVGEGETETSQTLTYDPRSVAE